MFLHSPKSDSLIWPDLSMRMLSGFRSLWIKLSLCTCSTAKIYLKSLHILPYKIWLPPPTAHLVWSKGSLNLLLECSPSPNTNFHHLKKNISIQRSSYAGLWPRCLFQLAHVLPKLDNDLKFVQHILFSHFLHCDYFTQFWPT